MLHLQCSNLIKSNPLKVQKDTFLIRVESDRNADLGIVGGNGKKIIVDTDYNKYKHTTQVGQIFACPITITEQYGYDTPLMVGDRVIFHHFVCQPDHKIEVPEETNIYRAEYFHLYAKLFPSPIKMRNMLRCSWEVHPLEDIIFVEPIMESEDNLYAGKIRIKTHQENLKQTGIVFAASKRARAMGVQDGDKVFFTSNADYQLKVGDMDLYRMRIRNIVAIERDGKLICLADKILVRQITDNKTPLFLDAHVSAELNGIVKAVGSEAKGIKINELVSYYNGSLGSLEYQGETYSMIELRNINYIIE